MFVFVYFDRREKDLPSGKRRSQGDKYLYKGKQGREWLT